MLSKETIAKTDIVIVGAGFAGLYMTKRLVDDGFSVDTIEAGHDIGGTWYWNRYPGARCDIESVEYSYQFSDAVQQEWQWSERYASQAEILNYINFVADKFSLRKFVRLGIRVESATFNQKDSSWFVGLSTGESIICQYFILAVGNLSKPFIPEIEGRSKYSGITLHTARWPQSGIDFADKRVGVIGTGSSGVQCIPVIAEKARRLTVFQRTPTFTVPAGNKPIDPVWLEKFKLGYGEFRERNKEMLGGFSASYPPNEQSALAISEKERLSVYEKRWNEIGGLLFMQSFSDLLLDEAANHTAAEFIRNKIKQVVSNDEISSLLSPEGPVGCKRLCVDTNYYATYNKSNVSLVDVSGHHSIKMDEDGIIYGSSYYPLDLVVFATGFDAITGSILSINIIGEDGITLKKKWENGPLSFLGACTADFPNMFSVCGPGNPSVLSNMVSTIEHHVDWIADCLKYAKSSGYRMIQATRTAETEWMAEADKRVRDTLFYNCNSWYLGANIPSKPRKFIPYLGFSDYLARCNDISSRGYPGLLFE